MHCTILLKKIIVLSVGQDLQRLKLEGEIFAIFVIGIKTKYHYNRIAK